MSKRVAAQTSRRFAWVFFHGAGAGPNHSFQLPCTVDGQRGRCPPRTPHHGPPAPIHRFTPRLFGETYQWGPEAQEWGVLGGQGPPSVFTSNAFSIHSRNP